MEMSGSAKIDQDNVVYLGARGSDSAKITVNSSLSNSPAACITPQNYIAGTQVLNGSTLGTEYGKFKVTPQDSGGGTVQNWTIDSNGYLQMQ